MTRMVSGLQHDEYLVETGRVQMLEMLYFLSENLDNSARAIDEHKRRTTDTERNISTQRDLAFAGSVWWDPSRKPAGK